MPSTGSLTGDSLRRENTMTISAEAQKSVEEIHNSKKRVEESIAKDPKSLSSDTLKEFTKGLSDVDGLVVEAILSRKEDVLENVDLRELVFEYFGASLETLEFLSEVENCLRDLESSHYHLIVAIKKYEKKKLKECQDRLQQFLDIGDPFQKRFYPMFKKLRDTQQGLSDKVQKTFDEMFRKREAAEAAERAAAAQAAAQAAAAAAAASKSSGWFSDLLQIVAASATVVTAICTAITPLFPPAGAVAVGAATIAVAAGVAIAIMDGEGNEEGEQQTRKAETEKAKTEQEENRNRKEKLKIEEEIRKEIYRTTTCVIQELDMIKHFADDLTKEIESLGKYAADGVKDEDIIDEVIEDVKNQAKTFRVDINHLTTHTRGCKEYIMTGRDKVVALINRT